MNDTPTAAPTEEELAKAGIIEAAAKIAEGYSFYEASDYPVCGSIAREIRKLAETATPGVLTCAALPDHADILETIENAGATWEADAYASALAEVRDMANIGRALMDRLPEGYSYNDCPTEIVTDLQNEIADLTSEATEVTGEAGNHDCLAKRAPDEPYFVILARDPDGPTIVDLWAQRRRAAGGDPEHCNQVDAIAAAMRIWRAGPTGFASNSAPDAAAYSGATRSLPSTLAGHWDTPDGREMASNYLSRERSTLCKGEVSDMALANAVFMASRNDLDLMVWQTAAKERIRWLSAQLAAAKEL